MCLWALDERLAQIVRGTQEGALGEIRLAWWREALAALPDKGPPQGEPLLAGLAELGLDPGLMSGLADGWAALLEPMPLADEALERFAALRGGALFVLSAALLAPDGDPRAEMAGAGWALADLSRRMSHKATAARAREMGTARLAGVRGRWPRALRPLAVLTALARRDTLERAGREAEPLGAPGRVARALWAGLTGR